MRKSSRFSFASPSRERLSFDHAETPPTFARGLSRRQASRCGGQPIAQRRVTFSSSSSEGQEQILTDSCSLKTGEKP
jgi:hypothetical protein